MLSVKGMGFNFYLVIVLWVWVFAIFLWPREVILLGVCQTKYPMDSQTYSNSSKLVAGMVIRMIMFVKIFM